LGIPVRVARWYIFKPKIPIWINFGGPFMAIWSILPPLGIVCGHLVYFGIFFPFWYVVPRKIWQPWFRSLHELLIQTFFCLLWKKWNEHLVAFSGLQMFFFKQLNGWPWRIFLSLKICRTQSFLLWC
jgi:hypothetical protein